MAQSKYDRIIKPNLEVISGMAKKGVSEKDIAEHFNVAYSTFRKYKSEHDSLSEALSYGTEEANAVLSGVLFDIAKGFYKEIERPIKIKRSEYKDGKKVREWEEIEYVKELQYFPPNLGGLALWLTNHDSGNYSKNPKAEVKASDGGVVLLSEIVGDENG